jgi:hypothetical protein
MRSEHISSVVKSIDFTKNSHAVLSGNARYRYWLHRSWFTGNGWTVFLLLNPSTADGLQNDPTLRRCIGFAQLWGSRGVIIVNLFAYRSTEPNNLLIHNDPVGPQIDLYLRGAFRMSPRIICGWGAHVIAKRRTKAVLSLMREERTAPYCLGVTANGSPSHPLYTSAKAEVVPYNGR